MRLIGFIPILLLMIVPAAAQTTYLRDRNGNLLGYDQHLPNGRTDFRDVNGNLHGYSQRLSNGTVEFRDNNGNLTGTARPSR